MQDKEWHTLEVPLKQSWGDGEWVSEPDKMQFTDKATGLPCLIVRNRRSGVLCGYVGVPASHPAYGKDYYDEKLQNIEVHGGLTYANFCFKEEEEGQGICHVVEDGEDDKVWWLGFDCAHAWDLSPANEAVLRKHNIPTIEPDALYRNVAYVKKEIASLASQLIAIR